MFSNKVNFKSKLRKVILFFLAAVCSIATCFLAIADRPHSAADLFGMYMTHFLKINVKRYLPNQGMIWENPEMVFEKAFEPDSPDMKNCIDAFYERALYPVDQEVGRKTLENVNYATVSFQVQDSPNGKSTPSPRWIIFDIPPGSNFIRIRTIHPRTGEEVRRYFLSASDYFITWDNVNHFLDRFKNDTHMYVKK